MKLEQQNAIPLLGNSNSFQTILEEVSNVAKLNRPILVIGERGTGKELIAQRLHFLSTRWQQCFLKVNCATLTESLLDTELFGHEAGAFTGASKRHIGRFEQANNGTFFLDEIANTSARLQEKLLRVIEYGEFERVGGSQTLQADLRFIAATNVDLPSEVQKGSFRADLLDRLAFAVITIPPLRARDEDCLLLAEHFGQALATELGWHYFPGFTNQTKKQLMDYQWPGNVRELKNVIERSVYQWAIPSKPINHINFDPFDSIYRPQTEPIKPTIPTLKEESINLLDQLEIAQKGFKQSLQDIEINIIQEALQKNHYHQRQTADYLGLTYHQLRAHLRKFPSNLIRK